MSVQNDIRRLRRSIEEQQANGHVDVAEIVSKLKRLEHDASNLEDDAEDFERKYKKLKRSAQ
jgi:hypothetical protein